MPTVRTSCPNCDTVIVDAGELTVRRRRHAEHSECAFTCPSCRVDVVHELTDRMVPVLLGAGCQVEDWETSDSLARQGVGSGHPSLLGDGAITEAEIIEFVAAMDEPGWFDELLH